MVSQTTNESVVSQTKTKSWDVNVWANKSESMGSKTENESVGNHSINESMRSHLWFWT